MEHDHCDKCLSSNCSRSTGCSTLECSKCGIIAHSCKIQDHVDEICPESEIRCINAQYGCPAEMRRRDLRVHLLHCLVLQEELTPTSVTKCEYCMCSVPEYDVQDHLKLCLELTVDCTNKLLGCTVQVKRKTLPEHLEHCSASIIGCNYSRWYRETDLHPRTKKMFGGHDITTESLAIDEKFILSNMSVSDTVEPRSYSDKGFTYVCNELIRRDELYDHWMSHVNFVDDLPTIVIRCPLASYGCTYNILRSQPAPHGNTLDYSPWMKSFVVKPPSLILEDQEPAVDGYYATEMARKRELLAYGYGDDTFGSLDVLGQLPLEVLLLMFSFCDSLSLWCLSQTNHYLRQVCLEISMFRGIVVEKWANIEGKWTSIKSRSYSKVFKHSGRLLIQNDVPCVGQHMSECKVFKQLKDNKKYQLESGVWNVHPIYPPLLPVSIQEADFNRDQKIIALS